MQRAGMKDIVLILLLCDRAAGIFILPSPMFNAAF